MILAKVAYDASKQQFRLTDPQLAGAFKDGEMYLVIVDVLPKEMERAIGFSQDDFEIDFSGLDSSTNIGHA